MAKKATKKTTKKTTRSTKSELTRNQSAALYVVRDRTAKGSRTTPETIAVELETTQCAARVVLEELREMGLVRSYRTGFGMRVYSAIAQTTSGPAKAPKKAKPIKVDGYLVSTQRVRSSVILSLDHDFRDSSRRPRINALLIAAAAESMLSVGDCAVHVDFDDNVSLETMHGTESEMARMERILRDAAEYVANGR